ncbi:hypothetical protein D3C75_439220 [compost metagenome]
MIGLYALWVCGPLIPAILIYILFPETKVVASGPLSTLSIRATGAFAAYLIVFIVSYPICLRLQDMFSDQQRPVWTIIAEVIATDQNGQPITYSNFYDGMEVTFSPAFQVVAGRDVTLKIPMVGSDLSWPKITFTIPNYGGTTIDPGKYEPQFRINKSKKEIRIEGAIPLQPLAPQGMGYTPITSK